MTSSLRFNKFPLPEYQGLLLVTSSCFFLFPCIYGLIFEAYRYSLTSFVTSLVSINYWRHAVPGLRKSTDMVIAKVSFAIFFVTGCLYVRDPLLLVVGWSIFPFIVYSYHKSNQEWYADSSYWVYYHMMFHFFVAIEQTIIIIGTFAMNSTTLVV